MSDLVKIGFSNNGKIGSKAIRHASQARHHKETGEVVELEDIPSHTYWIFFGDIVIESAFPKGFRIQYYEDFKKHNKVIAEYRFTADFQHSNTGRMRRKVCEMYHGKKYDWKGVLFQGWRIMLNVIFGFEIPKDNMWESSNRISCQEAFEFLSKENHKMVGKPVHEGEISLEMATPYAFMLYLANDEDFVKIN